MAERLNTNKAKHQRSLSVTKRKGGLKDRKSSGAGTSLITSFFNNAPPPTFACPLCGELVPRFQINQHIDSQCQNFQREHNGDDDAVSASNSAALKLPPLSPEKTPPVDTTACCSKEDKEETKTSPYFKKQSTSQHASREVSSTPVVRTIDLGSLSSKLSRKGLKSPDGTRSTSSVDRLSPERRRSSEEPSSSQKENLLPQVAAEDKTTCVLAAIEPRSAVKVESSSTSQEHEESQSGRLHTDVPPAPKSRLKRKKAEASEDGGKTPKKTSVLVKKGRYEEKKSGEPVEGGAEEEAGAGSSAVTESGGPTGEEEEEEEEETGGAKGGEGGAESPWLPYYLRNFVSVLEAVLENEDDRALFDQEDLAAIRSFERLSVPGQKLYVRLFQRKLKWLQGNKLDYGEISADLRPVVQELVDVSFLQTDRDLQELGEVLDLLPAPELRGLAKTFHLGGPGTQKQQLVDGLLRLSRQKSLFALAPGQNSRGAVILKRAKQLAGTCVRLHRGPRAVFSRVLLLFSLTDTMEEEETAAGGHGQLYTILLVNSGRLAFPDYKVQRGAKLFQDRDDLIRYEAAVRSLQEVGAAMQTGRWDEALALYASAKAVWQEQRKTHDLSHQERMPVFLRCFTTGWTYTRIQSRGVEILQRLRHYEEAVKELRSLLGQSVYCPDSRGRWWDRLALNLQQHLKQPEQAIAAIKEGLSDPLVRTGLQLSLHQRAVRMKESASFKKYRLQLRDLPTIHVGDVTHVTIRGQLFPHEGGTGKSVFLMPDDGRGGQSGDSTVMCSVEELSLAHYRQQGFDQGIHGEGSTFSTLFGLLLWDIVFMEGITDVFRNPYQTCPLDLFTDCFYDNRREAIESRVQVLREASVETLHSFLFEAWASQEGRVCSLVNWERFSSLEQAQSLVSCLGGGFLGGMILRMARDYRHCRGGLPDLVVWNTSDHSYKLVEVKGPSDRLSQKQLIWLDELQRLGADVEVCHVTSTGARGSRLEQDTG